jgi:cyclopropane-fatty-acyl-phospholipid synthase
MLNLFIELMERGLLPDWLIRFGIRRLCGERLASLRLEQPDPALSRRNYAAELAKGGLAEATREANQQHYEVPTEFFVASLGKARKYSCAYFPSAGTTLEEAETYALDLTIAHAELSDGQRILELGCGWGSLTLHMARKFPSSRITAISNSRTQKEYIEGRAFGELLTNVEVKTLDLSTEASASAIEAGAYDRVVSVEMFEHFKNYALLLQRVRAWLKPGGKLFVHIFTHERYSYPFLTEGSDNWMGKYFFTGGQMPSRDLLTEFQRDLHLEQRWNWGGEHYARTSEEWLKNLDRNHAAVLKAFTATYGQKEAARWLERWRVFFLSCAELFGYREGNEWGVTHYLFSRK